jgi:hypothetical protein
MARVQDRISARSSHIHRRAAVTHAGTSWAATQWGTVRLFYGVVVADGPVTPTDASGSDESAV